MAIALFHSAAFATHESETCTLDPAMDDWGFVGTMHVPTDRDGLYFCGSNRRPPGHHVGPMAAVYTELRALCRQRCLDDPSCIAYQTGEQSILPYLDSLGGGGGRRVAAFNCLLERSSHGDTVAWNDNDRPCECRIEAACWRRAVLAPACRERDFPVKPSGIWTWPAGNRSEIAAASCLPIGADAPPRRGDSDSCEADLDGAGWVVAFHANRSGLELLELANCFMRSLAHDGDASADRLQEVPKADRVFICGAPPPPPRYARAPPPPLAYVTGGLTLLEIGGIIVGGLAGLILLGFSLLLCFRCVRVWREERERQRAMRPHQPMTAAAAEASVAASISAEGGIQPPPADDAAETTKPSADAATMLAQAPTMRSAKTVEVEAAADAAYAQATALLRQLEGGRGQPTRAHI